MKISFSILLILFSTFSLHAQNDSLYVLDLQDCINIAIENNLTVRRSQLQKENARINLTQSKANLLPNLNVGGNYGYNWGRSIDPTTNTFINQQINFAGVSGSANVTLFNWFRLANSVRQSRLDYESSEYDERRAKNDISLDIVTFYLNVIFNRELVENARYQLRSTNEQLERTRKMVQGGALPRTSELELVSQVATNEVNLVNAENNLNFALVNLKQAMLIPVSQSVELLVPELDIKGEAEMERTVQEVYQAALEAMPEIRSAQLQVESALIGTKIAEAGYAPTISLSGGFRSNYSDAFTTRFLPDGTFRIITGDDGTPVRRPTFYRTAEGVAVEEIAAVPNGEVVDFGFSEQLDEHLSRSLTLNLSVPIFNNLQVRSNVQRSRISLQQAEIALTEQKNFLRQTIETAFNDAEAAAKTYAASLRQVEALEETFRSVENQYNLGATNFTDYQISSNNLFGARSDLVRAKYDFIFKKKILDFYQGKSISF